MSDDEIPFSIDAREVLLYLNELGINNISGDMLREFIKDLKRLIIHDLRQQNKLKSEEKSVIDKVTSGYLRLYNTHTISSLSRSKNPATESKDENSCQRSIKTDKLQRKPSVKILKKPKINNVSPIPDSLGDHMIPDTKSQNLKSESQNKHLQTEVESTTAIKKLRFSGSVIHVPIKKVTKRSDPVTLYKKYTTLWEKHTMPGEKNWNDVRWAVKKKLNR